jgi:WD40 repeat protein
MGDQHKGAGERPEPPSSYEEELMDEVDSDMEPESDDLRPLWQPVYAANQQSIERVYARLQSIESTRPPMAPAPPASRQSSATPTSTVKGTPIMNSIKTTMPAQTKEPSSPSRRRSLSPSRLSTIAAVLATGVLLTGTLLGFLYFRGGRPSQPGPTPQLSAKLQCQGAPFIDGNDGRIVFNGEYNTYNQNPLDWSTPDDISFANPPTLIWNPQTCRPTASQSILQAAMNSKALGDFGGQVVLSPDGKRALLINADKNWVLDVQTGSILTTLRSSGGGINSGYGQAVWTDGGSRIVAVTSVQFGSEPQFAYKVQEWDSRTGAFLRTAITFPSHVSDGRAVWLSPDASHAVMLLANHSLQFWNIATGQVISTTPRIATGIGGTVAWSPDGSYFAFGVNSADPSGIPGQTQIWSSRTGQLVITLPDTDTLKGLIGALSWSPNGRYLAESSGQITIWNTSTWQKAAVFDTVATSTALGHGVIQFKMVETLTWSPDSSELASVTFSYTNPFQFPTLPHDNLRLSVWKLTPVSAPTVLPETPTAVPAPTLTPAPSASPTTPTPTPVGSLSDIVGGVFG